MITKLLISILFVSSLAGCAMPVPDNHTYYGGEVGQERHIRFGTVQSIRYVMIDQGRTGVGTGAGAILGGIAGSQIGHGSGSVAAAVLGAVIGGVAGQALEGQGNRVQGVELGILLDNGQNISVTQTYDQQFMRGQRVRLLSDGYRTRVTY